MIGPTTGRTDYRDAQVAVVLSVTWAGRTWRLAARALTGTKWGADPGLVEAPDLSDEISLEPGGDVGVSVPVAFVLPAVDVAAYIAAGFDAHDIDLEVAWVWHRDAVLVHEWSAREVRAKGFATEAMHSDPEQPAGYIACTIEDSPYRTERPVARWAWAVSADTWPDSPELGARYPLVLGRPAPGGEVDGPPAPVINQIAAAPPTNNAAAVSVGWCRASAVTVLDSVGGSAVIDITYIQDGLGQTVAIVDIAGSSLDDTDGTTYTTAWTAGPALAPLGRYDPMSLAAYLLAVGGAAIDLPEWLALAGLLDLDVGGLIDDPESRAWEVARDLLTGLPVTMRRARDGWAPVILDPYLADKVATATWDDGGPFRRVSAWTGAGEARVGRVEVASDSGDVRVGASDARDASLPHAWVRHLAGQNEAATQASWSWTASTAWRQASWAARIGAMGWEVSAWQVPAEWGRDQAGTWVYLASEKRYALVQRRTLSGGVWDYALARPRGR
jgi:hypothetical protein